MNILDYANNDRSELQNLVEYRHDDTKARLRRSTERMIDRLQDLLSTLDNGRTVNSLGELQGSGNEIDRLCGELSVLASVRDDINRAAMQDDK